MSEYTLMLEIEMEGLKSDLAEARAQIAAKDAALLAAREALVKWHQYADEYFQDTQDLASDLERIDAELAAPARETE